MAGGGCRYACAARRPRQGRWFCIASVGRIPTSFGWTAGPGTTLRGPWEPVNAMGRLAKRILAACAYWALFGTAVLLLAFAVLGPEWRDRQSLREQHQRLIVHVAQLRDEADRLRRCQAGLPKDPALNEVLARLQLGYLRPGEQELWSPPSLMRPAAAVERSAGPKPPREADNPACAALMAGANHPRGRTLMLLLALALLVVAVLAGLLPSRAPHRHIPVMHRG